MWALRRFRRFQRFSSLWSMKKTAIFCFLQKSTITFTRKLKNSFCSQIKVRNRHFIQWLPVQWLHCFFCTIYFGILCIERRAQFGESDDSTRPPLCQSVVAYCWILFVGSARVASFFASLPFYSCPHLSKNQNWIWFDFQFPMIGRAWSMFHKQLLSFLYYYLVCLVSLGMFRKPIPK